MERGEKDVCVCVNAQESRMGKRDIPHHQRAVENASVERRGAVSMCPPLSYPPLSCPQASLRLLIDRKLRCAASAQHRQEEPGHTREEDTRQDTRGRHERGRQERKTRERRAKEDDTREEGQLTPHAVVLLRPAKGFLRTKARACTVCVCVCVCVCVHKNVHIYSGAHR